MGQARDQTAAFVAAIRSYDWEAAKRLARSQQEEGLVGPRVVNRVVMVGRCE